MNKPRVIFLCLLILIVGTFFSCRPKPITLEAITVRPNKTSYIVGSEISASDIEVVATYSDGSTLVVTNYILTPRLLEKEGAATITVSFTDGEIVATATYEVLVLPIPTFTVTFNSSNANASGLMESQTFDLGKVQRLTECGFKLAGYYFAGWALSEGEEAKYKDMEPILVDEDISLYAVWELVIGVEGITLSCDQNYLDLTQPFQLTATVFPDNATDKRVYWTSSDLNVATVSSSGIVRAKDSSVWKSVKITATTRDGNFISECEFLVIKYPTVTRVKDKNGKETDFVAISDCSMPLAKDASYYVTLTRGFEICDHIVTNAEYASVVGGFATSGRENYPVVSTTWYKMIAYCNQLTAKKNITRKGSSEIDYAYFSDAECTIYYSKKDGDNNNKSVYMRLDTNGKIDTAGYRLPTQAEWEVAARGGLIGDVYATANVDSILDEYAWHSSNSLGSDPDNEAITTTVLHEVKQLKPNNYGLYDMSGNAWEWCWDKAGDPHWPNPSVENPCVVTIDPLGLDDGTKRVKRGGSFCDPPDWATVHFWWSETPNTKYSRNTSFRVVRSIF